MRITYQDELGVVSVQVNDDYGVTFSNSVAYFTGEDGEDYKVDAMFLISITKEE